MSDNPQAWNYILAAIKAGKISKHELLVRLRAMDGQEDGADWEKDCKSFGQLSSAMPRFLIEGLIPEKALTAIPAPSYNCKTWFAMQCGLSLSTGKDVWGFKGPGEKVPCVYHVPEMNEAFVRNYMAKIGFEDSRDFLVRPMECGLWPLDNPKMLASSKGRYVFLDTMGYFNPAEDSSSYQQSLKFASLVYNLLQQGAIGVAALIHPPKYSSQVTPGKTKTVQEWTLENSILGSAGYGGMLRSCLRMANLNKDKNDQEPWVYVQGLKNPGLRPFQLSGTPLRMLVKDSPYINDLLGLEPRKAQAFAMFEEGRTQRVIQEALRMSARDVSAYYKEWMESKVKAEEQAAEPDEQEGFDYANDM